MRGGLWPPAPTFPIAPRAYGETAGTAAWNLRLPPPPKPRVVRFSSRRSLGTLYVKTSSVFQGRTMLGRSLAPARGEVTVPAGASLLLEVSEGGVRDLSPLAALGPRDLQMVSLSCIGATVSATDETLAHLRGLTWLEWLDLGCTEVTGAGLVHLAGMGLLEQLDLWGTYLTADGLARLPELPHLRRLNLSISLELGAGGLAHLSGRLPALEELDMHSNEIGDEAVPHLRRLSTLRDLNVSSTWISPGGVAELRAALPRCRISAY